MQQNVIQGNRDSQDEPTLFEKVRARILSGEFEPGSLVPEAGLADDFGVSRTPIREVLKQLERQGLVEIQPRVGTFVHKPTRREISELFQLKEGLEGWAAGLLARRGPVPELDILQRNCEESELAVEQNNSKRYAELVHEFHWTLVRGADNKKLYEQYEWMMHQLVYHQLVLKTVTKPSRLLVSNSEHHQVLEAIREKDAMAAEFAMRSHVHTSSQLAMVPEEVKATTPEPFYLH